MPLRFKTYREGFRRCMFNFNHDFQCITLKAMCPKEYTTNRLWRKNCPMPQVSKESACQVVVDFLKKQKNTEKIDVAMVEAQDDGWVVRGTWPIDLEGHQRAEKFAVVIDL